MKLLAAAILLFALVAPSVGAQAPSGTFANPIFGSYGDTYIIAGRAVDALGNPAVGADIIVVIEQEGVTARPLLAKADCFGLFITYFTIGYVDPKGVVKVTLRGTDGGPSAHNSTRFDTFYRRSDLMLRYEGEWSSSCPDQTPLWHNRASLMGRIVNRTETYEHNGTKLDAVPYVGRASLRYFMEDGSEHCPVDQKGDCETIPVDERGDFRYSWIFQDPINATGTMQVRLLNKTWDFPLDPFYRTAVARVELSGAGPPPPKKTPDVPLAIALLAVGALALAAASRRQRRG